MKKDYHIHATVAQDPIRAELFVQQAIRRGFDEICITDHMPLSISSASDRIPHGRVKEYCEGVRALARKYENRIVIRTGIEIDYHPSLMEEIEAVLSEGEFDIVLGSSHLHLFKEQYFAPPVSRREYVEAMLNNTKRAAQTGLFDVIPHMDMYRWVFTWSGNRPQLADDGFSEEEYESAIDDVLHTMYDNGVRLEINPHFAESTGILTNTYPSEWILQRALSMGVRFSYGSDAHHPESVGALWQELWEHPTYGRAIRQWERDSIGGAQ